MRNYLILLLALFLATACATPTEEGCTGANCNTDTGADAVTDTVNEVDEEIAQENECGGTETLDHLLGESCGNCGQYVCDGLNALRCDEGAGNACGGCAALTETVNQPCGECGTVQCDGVDATFCDDPGLNSCNGCAVLTGVAGEACGECSMGTWTCDGTEAVTCVGDEQNVCGGCADFGIRAPGDPCGECGGGTLACDGTEALLCEGANPTNECGGCTVLNGTVGASCGTCYSGSLACNSAGTGLVCEGEVACEPCQADDNNDTFDSAIDLGDFDDKDNDLIFHSSDLYSSSDVDFLVATVQDTATGALIIRAQLDSTEDLEFCAYWERSNGQSSNLECTVGNLQEFGGLEGCCSDLTGAVLKSIEMEDGVAGGDDGGTVYYYVAPKAALSACVEYELGFAF